MPRPLLRVLFAAIGIAGLSFSVAAQTPQLLAFAKANQNRFSQELKAVGGIGPGSVVSLRMSYGTDRLYGVEYDTNSGALVFTSKFRIYEERAFIQCTPSGSYLGQNAFGVKIKVDRQKCAILLIKDDDGMDATGRESRIPMSPDQYRTVKAQGLEYEVDFKIDANAKQEVVEFQQLRTEPTVIVPVESESMVWTVHGAVQAARWFVPGGRTHIVEYRRQSDTVVMPGEPSNYARRVLARINPNIIYAKDAPRNLSVEVELRAAADGRIVGRKLVKSSDLPVWDEAVLKAIDRTETLPCDVDGLVPPVIVINFRPEGVGKVEAAGGRFVIQIADFANADQALEVRQKLERAGLKTYAQVVDTKDGKRTRVRIGPFTSKDQAEQNAEKVKAMELPAMVLVL